MLMATGALREVSTTYVRTDLKAEFLLESNSVIMVCCGGQSGRRWTDKYSGESIHTVWCMENARF